MGNKASSSRSADKGKQLLGKLNGASPTSALEVLGQLDAYLRESSNQQETVRALVEEHPKSVSKLISLCATPALAAAALKVVLVLAQHRSLPSSQPALVPTLIESGQGLKDEDARLCVGLVLERLLKSGVDPRTLAGTCPMLFAQVESTARVQLQALLVLQLLTMESAVLLATRIGVLIAKLDNTVEDEALQLALLGVLKNLVSDAELQPGLASKHPELVATLLSKLKLEGDEVPAECLRLLTNLVRGSEASRQGVVGLNPTLVGALVSKLFASKSDLVQSKVVHLLTYFSLDGGIAAVMVAEHSAQLLPVLADQIRSPASAFAGVNLAYQLSCSAPNRAVMRRAQGLVDALAAQRRGSDENVALFALLTLVNLFGTMDDSPWLNAGEEDGKMLVAVFGLLERAMRRDGWALNKPLLAFRYLCVVSANRQALWKRYSNAFLVQVLAALQCATTDRDSDAADNAMSVLTQFSFDDVPLVWIQANRSRVQQAVSELEQHPVLFKEAIKSSQFLWLRVDPPSVSTTAVSVSSKPTIMISYNWEFQTHARHIHHLLNAKGYQVWRDEQNMKTNIILSMADAVGQSKVVLVLVSHSYKESPNCQMECMFAHNNNRVLVPVLVEPGYVFKADGWLGLMLGSKLYYDVSMCSKEVEMEPRISSLVEKEVEAAPEVVVAVAEVAAAERTSDKRDLRDWLGAEGEPILSELAKEGFVSNSDLLALSKMSTGEIRDLVKNLTGKQVLDLQQALKRLF